ncbi:MAG: BadF/BadG/BcrA/BcrD ATPase family protein [Candidatus Limiplasma sp.]|nr:BadF/BadG/BcrA/BcrD ATPase family protein [Candidatus Limiplasma sp.]
MILAIDQGSSKTEALIGDENGVILGAGSAEGACHFLVGMDKAMKAARSAAEAAMRSAGVGPGSIGRVSAGMAGANWPNEFEMLTRELEALFHPAKATVYNDCVPALYAGSQSANAVILCAGTSFNAAVLKKRKVVWIYNNYTESVDEGGKSLATRAMESVFRSMTGMGPQTSLKERALEFFAYDDMLSMLLDFSRGCMRKPLKDFAVVVDEEAMCGDEVALNAQYEFGLSVSRYATAALKRYELVNEPADIVLSGGIFKARSVVMVDAIRTQVHRVAPKARIVEALYEPVVGAYELALDPAGQAEWWPRIEETAERFSLVRFDDGGMQR